MRTHYLVCTLCLFMLGIPALVSGQRVTASYNNTALALALGEIRDRYQIKFAFDNKLLEGITLTATFRNIPIEEILAYSLRETPLTYQKAGEVYMILPQSVRSENDLDNMTITATDTKPLCFIQGVVRDKNSGENLPFASVWFSDASTGTTTNQDGFFSIQAKTCASTMLMVSYLGYEPLSMQVTPVENPQPLIIMLGHHMEFINPVTISHRQAIFDLGSSGQPGAIKFNPSRMVAVPSYSDLDIVAPIQLMPGIDGTSETAAGFSIRKSPADKNLILYDGFTLYQVDHFFGSFSSLNAKAIKDIQVHKGGYDARFGGRTAGMLEITGKSGNLFRHALDAGADLLSTNIMVEGPIVREKISYIVTMRRSFTDVIRSGFYQALFDNVRYDFQQYYRNYPSAFGRGNNNPMVIYADLTSKLTWHIATGHTLSLSTFGSNDQMEFRQLSTYPKVTELATWKSRGLSLRYGGSFSEKWVFQIVAGFSNTANLYDHADTTVSLYRGRLLTFTDTVSSRYRLDNALGDFSLNLQNSYQIDRRNRIETGFQSNRLSSSFFEESGIKLNRGEVADTLRDYQAASGLFSPFFQYVFDNGTLLWRIGMRGNYYSVTQTGYPEWRTSAIYKLFPSLTFKASAGRYHQFANRVNSVTLGDFRYAWIISDGNRFPVVIADVVMAGFTIRPYRGAELDAEVYLNGTSGKVLAEITTRRTGNSLVQESRFYYADTKVTGLDLLMKQHIGPFNIWLAYTLNKSTTQSAQLNEGNPYPSFDDQLHEIKLYNTYSYKNLQLSISALYGSGKRWNKLELSPEYKLTSNNGPYGHRLPNYMRFDGSAMYSLRKKSPVIKAGIGVFNLFDQENLLYRFMKLSDTPLRDIANERNPLISTDVKGMGRLVNLFLNVRLE